MRQLVQLISDHPDVISFDENGILVIPSPPDLEKLLPNYYRTAKLASFQRQLNNFGYHRVGSLGFFLAACESGRIQSVPEASSPVKKGSLNSPRWAKHRRLNTSLMRLSMRVGSGLPASCAAIVRASSSLSNFMKRACSCTTTLALVRKHVGMGDVTAAWKSRGWSSDELHIAPVLPEAPRPAFSQRQQLGVAS